MDARFVLTALDDQTLLERLRTVVDKNNDWTASLLAYLAEVDKRELYLRDGFSSMFEYCVEKLGMCEGGAYKQTRAARAARQFPIIFELVASGQIHVSGVVVLAPLLTQENHRDVLEQAKRKSKRAIEELVAKLAPKPDVPPTIRKLPAPKAEPLLALAAPQPKAPVAPSPPPQPLSEDRFKVQFTASRELRDKIATVQALMRHQVPDGDLEKIFDKAIDLLRKDLEKKKLGAADKPKPAQPTNHASRRIPNVVKRAVIARDGLQCAYVSPDGRRCTSRAFLEFHHVKAFAKGGEHTVANVKGFCRAHNFHDAKKEFGAAFMEAKRTGQPATVPGDSG